MNTTTIPQTAEVDEVTISRNVDGKIIIKDDGVGINQQSIIKAFQNSANQILFADDYQIIQQSPILTLAQANEILEKYHTTDFTLNEKIIESIGLTGNVFDGLKSKIEVTKGASNQITFSNSSKISSLISRLYIGIYNADRSQNVAFEYYSDHTYCDLYARNGAGNATNVITDFAISNATSFNKYKFVLTNSTAKFYINDILKGTITTNLPTGAVKLCIITLNTSGTPTTYSKNIKLLSEDI